MLASSCSCPAFDHCIQRFTVLLLASLLALATFTRGQDGPEWFQDQKISVDDGGYDRDYFGWSVALSGDTAVVGVPYADEGGDESGSAYVFVRQGGQWVQEARLTASDATGGDNFGWSVAVHGDTAVVAAMPAYGATGSISGAAYVFLRVGSTWGEIAKLTDDAPVDRDWFGASVDVDGDTLVVGSPDYDVSGGPGSVHVFRGNGSSWSRETTLFSLDGNAGDSFGHAISLDVDRLLIGARHDSDIDLAVGSAYVFSRFGTVWAQEAKLIAPDGVELDVFGDAVSLAGDTALIGAKGDEYDDGSFEAEGSAYIFVRSGTMWNFQQKLIANDPGYRMFMGTSVALAGDTAMCGAPEDGDFGENRGSVHVFVRSGTSWSERPKLVPDDAPYGEFFGYAVSVDGDRAVIGTPYDPLGSFQRLGSAYLFQFGWEASAILRNDSSNTNPVRYTASAPILGEDWIATVDNTGMNNFVAGVFGYAEPLELYLPLTGEYLLVDPLSPGGELLHIPPAYGYELVAFRVPIPIDVGLAGITLSTQGGGAGGGGGTNLHNAYDLVVGL